MPSENLYCIRFPLKFKSWLLVGLGFGSKFYTLGLHFYALFWNHKGLESCFNIISTLKFMLWSHILKSRDLMQVIKYLEAYNRVVRVRNIANGLSSSGLFGFYFLFLRSAETFWSTLHKSQMWTWIKTRLLGTCGTHMGHKSRIWVCLFAFQ